MKIEFNCVNQWSLPVDLLSFISKRFAVRVNWLLWNLRLWSFDFFWKAYHVKKRDFKIKQPQPERQLQNVIDELSALAVSCWKKLTALCDYLNMRKARQSESLKLISLSFWDTKVAFAWSRKHGIKKKSERNFCQRNFNATVLHFIASCSIH